MFQKLLKQLRLLVIAFALSLIGLSGISTPAASASEMSTANKTDIGVSVKPNASNAAQGSYSVWGYLVINGTPVNRTNSRSYSLTPRYMCARLVSSTINYEQCNWQSFSSPWFYFAVPYSGTYQIKVDWQWTTITCGNRFTTGQSGTYTCYVWW